MMAEAKKGKTKRKKRRRRRPKKKVTADVCEAQGNKVNYPPTLILI